MMIAGSSGGRPPKTVSWTGISYVPLYEGQTQTVQLDFANWDNSTVYWTLVEAGSSASLDSRVVGGQASGYINPGSGYTGGWSFNFTFSADATTEGPINYVVRVGSTPGNNDYLNQGNYALVDSSQTPTLVLDLDTASDVTNNIWVDSSGQNHNGGIYFLDAYSTDNGGVYLWNGSSTQAEVTGLNGSTYGTITLSAWIKPNTVTGSNQTIIAKELCYKLRINGDGTTTMSTGKGNSGWEVTATADAGAVTAGAWAHVVATSDTDYTRIYVNGGKVAETSGNIIGANTNPFDIGMYQTTGSPSDFFGGRMGEVKVWNYALTEANVVDQYNTHCTRYGLSTTTIQQLLGGTGTAGTGTLNGHPGHTVTLTPSTDGTNSPGTANPGDTITWNITSDSSLSGVRVYYWVDYDAVTSSTWTSGGNDGYVDLDTNGSGSFSRTVVSIPPVHSLFRMYIGVALHYGTITHGYIGV